VAGEHQTGRFSEGEALVTSLLIVFGHAGDWIDVAAKH
jgi:hypothetical protein